MLWLPQNSTLCLLSSIAYRPLTASNPLCCLATLCSAMLPLTGIDMLLLLFTDHMYCCLLNGLIIVLASWYLFHRKHQNPLVNLTKKEKDELIEEWQPDELVPPIDPNHFSLRVRKVSSAYGKMITVDGRQCLNMATHNYLGLLENEECLEAAVAAVQQFGVGSCGPRGFFGTVSVHLDIEQAIASFLGTEEAILYSFGYSTISSAIPAYAKLGDIIFADESVTFAIQEGIQSSRSTIRYFDHNDHQHLARLLAEDAAAAGDSKAAINRSRFIVVEGLYYNHGDICPLPEIVALKHQYKCRLFIDDSSAFGVLGEGGRGSVEHWNLDIEMDIDMIAASLEMTVAAYGGFCAGSHYIIDHQRLSGLGYCFSASLPPMQAAFGLQSIKLIDREPERVAKLHEICIQFHQLLLGDHSREFMVQGDPVSPIKHLRFVLPIEDALASRHTPSIQVIQANGTFYQTAERTPREFDTYRLEKVEQYAHEQGYALAVARYLENREQAPVAPSIRLAVTALLTESELVQSAQLIAEAFEAVHGQFQAGLI